MPGTDDDSTPAVPDDEVDADLPPRSLFDDPSPGVRALTWVVLVLVGVALGMVGAFVQAFHAEVGPLDVPWGLVLTLATVVACVRAGAYATGTRWGGAVVAAGWVLSTAAAVLVTPGDDVLLPDDWRSRAYVYGGALLVGVTVGLPVRRRPHRSADVTAEVGVAE